MKRKRSGRGRLSSIELLPDAADPIIAWAAQELKSRNRYQKDIGVEFNERLAALSKELGIVIEAISPSAFGRYAFKQAQLTRRIAQTREIAAVVTERLGPGEADQLTIAVTETIKNLIMEILSHSGEAGLPMKAAKEAAEAIRAAVAAEKMSSDRRQKVEKEFAEKATEAISKVGKAKGLDADTVAQLRREFLGLRE